MTKNTIAEQREENALLQRQIAQLEANLSAEKARNAGEIAALRGANRVLRDLSERMNILYEVERELNRSESFDALCRSAIELGCRQLGFDRLGLWLFVEGTDEQQGTFGIDEQGCLRDERPIRIPSPIKKFFAHFNNESEPLLFMEFISQEEPIPGFTNPIAALWDGKKVIGFLSCDNLLTHEPITEPQQQLLSLYASLLGALFARWQRIESERQFLAQMRSVYELERQLAHCEDFDAMCRLAVEEGRKRLGIDRLGLWFHEQGDLFRGTFGTDAHGQTVDERQRREIFSLRRFQSEFLEERQGVVVSQEAWNGEMLEVASAALWQGEEIIGVLFADNYPRYVPVSEGQRELLLLYVGMLTDLCVRRRVQEELRTSWETERQTVERMHTLYEVERELTHAESVDDLCRQAVELGRDRLGFERLGIWFFAPDRGEIQGTYGTDMQGVTQDERSLSFPYPVQKRIQQFMEGDFALVPDMEWIPEGANEAFLRLNAALWNGRQVMGYLSCDNLLTLAPISPVQQRLQVLYASTIGYLCMRKQAEQTLLRYNEELETRVQERTLELAEANRRLEAELVRRTQIEQALRSSEEHNRQLIELSADAIVLLKSGHFVRVNPAGVKMLGCQHLDELLGRSMFDFIHPDEHAEVRALAETFYQKGASYKREFTCVRADGSLICVDVVASPILRGEERLTLIILRDVTERRRMEQALRDSEERWQFALEGSGDGVWDLDLKTDRAFFSRQWKAMLGYAEEEVGETFADWTSRVHREDWEPFAAQQYAHERGETPFFSSEYRMRCRDGSYRWVLSRGKIMERQEDGTPLRIVGTHANITERKEAEAEIRRLHHDLQVRAAQLEAANEELETFCYSVSHDLRAPLRSIDGFSNALMEDYSERLDAMAVNYLQRVRTATQRMAQLIDDLLSLSRVTRSEIRRTQVDLSAMVQSVAAELTRTAPERKVEFVILPGMETVADASLMRIVLENLLGNAWKFTSKHPTARIEVGKAERDGEIIFFVRDDGAGFDMAYADKLFGAFQRLHGINEFEGTGIGLATVQRIIHRHGGRAWAEGAVEQGATFSFTF